MPPLLGGEPLSDTLESYGPWNGDGGGRCGCFWIISRCSGGLLRLLTGGGGDDGEVYVGESEFL